jgi:hypothetical protein
MRAIKGFEQDVGDGETGRRKGEAVGVSSIPRYNLVSVCESLGYWNEFVGCGKEQIMTLPPLGMLRLEASVLLLFLPRRRVLHFPAPLSVWDLSRGPRVLLVILR